jgi:predicted nuclease of predicted toxin-antitoxin system
LRFLLDESVSPLVKEPLLAAGHDVVHLHDLGLRGAPDPLVLETVVGEGRVLVTLDTDFGELVARSGLRLPSIVLFRGAITRRPSSEAILLLENLDQFEADLESGAVVVIGDDRVRVRRLPID